MNKQELLDEAYENFVNTIETNRPDGYIRPVISKEKFIFESKIHPEFSEHWGLKIEERELSLEERYGLVRVNGLCPKYSFEIEDGKPTSNKMSESEWYDNHNIPTKLITVTYKDKTIESYEQTR